MMISRGTWAISTLTGQTVEVARMFATKTFYEAEYNLQKLMALNEKYIFFE